MILSKSQGSRCILIYYFSDFNTIRERLHELVGSFSSDTSLQIIGNNFTKRNSLSIRYCCWWVSIKVISIQLWIKVSNILTILNVCECPTRLRHGVTRVQYIQIEYTILNVLNIRSNNFYTINIEVLLSIISAECRNRLISNIAIK